MTLRELKTENSAVIESVGGDGALRQHLLDMGVIPGASLTVIKYAPLGDPMEIKIHGYELTLRLSEAEHIVVRMTDAPQEEERDELKVGPLEHPGLGESGKYHPKGSGDPLPESEILTFALVGNQNSGKTTLFNCLTGSNQHVGNFPGVTVDRKDGQIKGHPDTMITDLPGIYSMSPYSSEEIVSRNFVLDEKPKAIINIVDVTNIERNLYLTMQLLEMNTPVVVALNMMDELTANGGMVYVNMMEELLGVPVVPISAARHEGIEELISHAIHIARYQEGPLKQDFCDESAGGGAVHRSIHAIIHLIQDHAIEKDIPLRFAASKVIEGDEMIIARLDLDRNEIETMEHIVLQMEKERGLDRSAAIADMRFSYIRNVCEASVKKPRESRERIRSEKIDRILTGKYTAIPFFIMIMGIVSYLTFNVIGAFLQELLDNGIDKISDIANGWLISSNVNDTLRSLIIDGIFEGVGSVLSFLPIIVTLFFFLSLLEDSGYIARVAFVMDKMLRKIGLSGRSIVPMLIGFGCTVPAVMASRTLPSERDRRMTILLTPFMSCTAKYPIYAFFVAAFFPKQGALIIVGLYLLGILTGVIIAFLYRRTMFKGDAVPFIMELPNYRLPGVGNVLHLMWDKAKDFLQRAFTVILVASMIIWLLQSFDLHLNLVSDSSNSILASVAGVIAPLMRPLGLGDWRICTSLISGVMAKESVVSTMEVLFENNISSVLTPVSAASLLVFSLLYTPCIAAIASIRRELGSKWSVTVALWQCFVAWIAAFIVHLIGMCVV